MNKIKIIVCGACGKMGTRIIDLAGKDAELQFVGGIERKGHPCIEESDSGISSNLSDIIANANVVVDFTNPETSMHHLDIAIKNKRAIVIGTTGFDVDQIKKIKEAGRKIPVVFSPNMSIGINLLFKLVEDVAKIIPDYDIEIVELHHNQKKDAPSGTAAKLYQILAKALGRNVDKAGVYGRHGIVGVRKKDEIGVLAVRAGDIVGEHTIYFAGRGERIELTHRAHSRDTLAAGALVAAKWIIKKKKGLFSMQDVLGIK
ncbi:MAG: 4-hydroxy-tetrahydrodipicolinate reductase [Endomicrobiales bacterium]|nr:4-hydroxy-tetrahydrodipicolinate reductase [Endomicrobiales bacterium]